MRIEIIKKSHINRRIVYRKSFNEVTKRKFWWLHSFPCFNDGTFDMLTMRFQVRQELKDIISGKIPAYVVGISKWVQLDSSPQYGRCVCGSIVKLSKLSNSCNMRCGKLYSKDGTMFEDPKYLDEKMVAYIYNVIPTRY